MRAFPFTLAVLALAASASAQDGSEIATQRTVEGAQQFLVDFYASLGSSAVMSDGAWLVEGRWQLGAKPADYSNSASIEADLIKVQTFERCKTRVTGKDIRRYSPWAYERGEQVPGIPAELSATIDWKGITAVAVEREKRLKRGPPIVEAELTGWYVYLNGPSGVSFLHGDEANARRAANAMEFLREQCGFKTDSGF